MEQEAIQAFDYEYDEYSTEELIEGASKLPIHQFNHQIPPGKVLDVGYKMGALVLYYASQGRQVHALDIEPYYEKKLKTRLKKEPYHDLVSFSIASVDSDKLPNEEFAIISICSVLHYFDFGTAQHIVDRLSRLLMPGGWIITKNHHKSHLYSNNSSILGPNASYKHFFSAEEIGRLFPKQIFTEKYIKVKNTFSDENQRKVAEYYLSLYPQHSRKWLRDNYYDVDNHTDITTIHQKLPPIQQ